MKLGFVSSILGELSFEEMIDFASVQGYECVEVACWPVGKANRRYAGVTHIDIDLLDQDKISYIKNYCQNKNIVISSLGYYPNVLDPDTEKSEVYINHLKKLIIASNKLGVGMITTFLGRDQHKNIQQNLELVKQVWPEIIALAKENNIKIAIENCPMLFSNDEWPGGQNLMTTPAVWRKVFEILPDDNFGLNYDPSHFIWQQIDYIKPLYEFKNKIFHVHFKDIKLYLDKLNQVGIMATPIEYMAPKLPGLGDVNWGNYVCALTDIGYDGCACIEIEDRAFEKNLDSVKKSVILSYRYMRQFVI